MGVLLVALRALLVAGAMVVVAATALSALRTFVLPRAANTFLSRLVFVTIRRGFDRVVRRLDTYERQDAVMALFAKVGLLALPVAWLVLVFSAYAVAYWAIDPAVGWQTAIDESGSALLTLGFRAPDDFPARLLGITEAALGLTLIALLITCLPSIYAAFSKREAAVQKLDVRAGTPPSAVTMSASRLGGGHHGADVPLVVGPVARLPVAAPPPPQRASVSLRAAAASRSLERKAMRCLPASKRMGTVRGAGQTHPSVEQRRVRSGNRHGQVVQQ